MSKEEEKKPIEKTYRVDVAAGTEVRIEKKLGTAKVSKKGQVTLPQTVRVILEVEPGDRIVFILRDSEIIVRKA